MRLTFILLTFGILTFNASAEPPANQNISRVFRFTSNPPPVGLQEIATVLRTVGDIRQLSIDAPSESISVTDTPAGIEATGWLVQQLDQPANLSPSALQVLNSATHRYQPPGNKDDVYQAFYLTTMASPQSQQELLTILRTVGQIQKVFVYSVPHALIVRGTASQIALSAWLIHELDSSVSEPGSHQFSSPGNADDVTQVFYLVNDGSVRRIQEVLSAVRTKAKIQYAFNMSLRRAVIARGSAGQIADAEQLVHEMDQPPAN